jgi:hypothetical protein
MSELQSGRLTLLACLGYTRPMIASPSRRYLVLLVILLMPVVIINIAHKELSAPVADVVGAELRFSPCRFVPVWRLTNDP